MSALRIVFMGTAEFAVPTLSILHESGYAIPAVVTAPDKPRGRGQEMLPTPVKRHCAEAGLTVLEPGNLTDPAFARSVRSLSPDLIVVVAFRILPREIFMIPRLGSLNLHASLLPRYRGAAPINRAVMNGEAETGVTTFFLEEKVDTGNILLQERMPILPEDDAGSVHDRLSAIGARVVLQTVRLIEEGKAFARPQDPLLASPAPKIFKEDCHIVWDRPVSSVRNQIRGLAPYPAAYAIHQGRVVKIYRASLADGRAEPGVIESGKDILRVGTGDGMLSIEVLQQEGKKKMGVSEFLRGYKISTGEKFE